MIWGHKPIQLSQWIKYPRGVTAAGLVLSPSATHYPCGAVGLRSIVMTLKSTAAANIVTSLYLTAS